MVRRRALISKYNLTAFMGLSYFRLSHIRKRTPHTNILVRVTYAASEIISDPDLYDVASTHFFPMEKHIIFAGGEIFAKFDTAIVYTFDMWAPVYFMRPVRIVLV